MNITFERMNETHQEAIFAWLDEPHVKEFWDNSPEHREDIVNFIQGRKEPSNYFDGIFTYWIGSVDEEAYCLVMTSEIEEDIPFELWKEHRSKTGATYGLDFCIGNIKQLGKGLAAPTLEAFTHFFKAEIDHKADTFFIDPDENNPRAFRVYEKAGFEVVGEYAMEDGYFAGQNAFLMVKSV